MVNYSCRFDRQFFIQCEVSIQFRNRHISAEKWISLCFPFIFSVVPNFLTVTVLFLLKNLWISIFAPAEFYKELFYYCWLNFIIRGRIYCPLNKSGWLSIKVWYYTAYLFTGRPTNVDACFYTIWIFLFN